MELWTPAETENRRAREPLQQLTTSILLFLAGDSVRAINHRTNQTTLARLGSRINGEPVDLP
jgi:hypothetical protein